MKFGIICAMPEEIKELTAALENEQVKEIGGKKYYSGQIDNQNVILVDLALVRLKLGLQQST